MAVCLFGAEIGNTAIFCTSFLFLYIIYKILARGNHVQKRLPPGPSGLPALKQLLTSIMRGDLHLAAEKWAKEYGEVVLCRTLLGNICFLNSATATREAYTNRECKSVTNERPRSFLGSFAMYNYKDVVTGCESLRKSWTFERKMFHSALKFYGDGVDRIESAVLKELQRLNETLHTYADGSPESNNNDKSSAENSEKGCQEIELGGMLYYSLMSVLCVLLIGECPASDDTIVGILGNLNNAFNEIFNPTNDKILSMFPFLRFIPGTRYKQICDDAIRTRDEMLQQVYRCRKAGYIPGQPRGIIDALRDEQSKKGNEWMTEEHIYALIIDILAAGLITTFNTLKSILMILMHHPEVMKKIQAEIDEKVGQRQPGFHDRKSMNYTDAVIMENFRYVSLFPIGVPHENCEEFGLFGFCIPKNSLLFSNNRFFHHDPNIWGDPENFRPERFLDESGNLLPSAHPVQQNYLPFGVGIRACPGENFGRTRVFLYLTNILQKYDLLPPVKHKFPPLSFKLWKNTGIVLEPDKTYVILKERSK